MKKQSIKKQLKKYYFNIFALNTSNAKNMFFSNLHLTKKELNEQVNYLMINGFNSISYFRLKN